MTIDMGLPATWLRELSLFSGGGGGLLGTKLLGFRVVCYVEKDRYCQKVLQARIKDGFLDDAPIWDDARAFNGHPWAGLVDVITAGFPCQPFSGAGKKLGEHDERNLWPDTIRIIREVGPEWLLLENVPRLLCFDYFGRILADLAESGFDARWDCIPASAVGAPHQRDRLWIVAHANRCEQGRRKQPKRKSHRRDSDIAGYGTAGKMADANQDEQQLHHPGKQSEISVRADSGRSGQNVADSDGRGFEERTQFDGEEKDDSADRRTSGGHVGGCSDQVVNALCEGLAEWKSEREDTQQKHPTAFGAGWKNGEWWSVEPEVGRVANGVPDRVAQLRAAGNGQVPAVVRAAWALLS